MGKYLIYLFLLLSSVSIARPVRVMVVDTGIDASHVDLLKYVEAGKYEDLHDDFGHGTHIAGIIAESGCPNLRIVSCKAFFKGHGIYVRLIECFQRALTENIDIINFSGGGHGAVVEEYDILKKLNDKGIKIIVSAGNDSKNLGSPCWGFFPACYENLYNLTTVGALTMHGERVESSNYGYPAMKWEVGEGVLSSLPGNKHGFMTGTSQAAAAYTKDLVKQMCYQSN